MNITFLIARLILGILTTSGVGGKGVALIARILSAGAAAWPEIEEKLKNNDEPGLEQILAGKENRREPRQPYGTPAVEEAEDEDDGTDA